MTQSLIVIAAAFGLLAPLAVSTQVEAATNNRADCGSIRSGLWSGINAALGTNYDCNGNNKRNTAPRQNEQKRAGGYVALGDSVAAGLGLAPARGADPVCGVSSQAYGARVAQQLYSGQYRNLACSGATAGDLFTKQRPSNSDRTIEPQIARAFANGTPSLVTVTAGANDLYWQTYIRKCYVSDCGTATDRRVASALNNAMRLKVEYALSRIAARSNGSPPTVIFTGYYQPFSGACAQQQSNVSASELNWLNGELHKVNNTIKSVVDGYDFARYAPVDFSGHELCSADPWVQGINAAAPLHPTARGQQAIAEAVIRAAR